MEEQNNLLTMSADIAEAYDDIENVSECSNYSKP